MRAPSNPRRFARTDRRGSSGAPRDPRHPAGADRRRRASAKIGDPFPRYRARTDLQVGVCLRKCRVVHDVHGRTRSNNEAEASCEMVRQSSCCAACGVRLCHAAQVFEPLADALGKPPDPPCRGDGGNLRVIA
jgi:hypothetical protein